MYVLIAALESLTESQVPLPLVAVGAAVLVGMCSVYYRQVDAGWCAYRSLSAHCTTLEKESVNAHFWLEQAQKENAGLRTSLMTAQQDLIRAEMFMEQATGESERLLTDPAYYRAKTNLGERMRRETDPDVATFSIAADDDTLPNFHNHFDMKA